MIGLPRWLTLGVVLMLSGFGTQVLAAQDATPPAQAPPTDVPYVDAGNQELARARVDVVTDPFEDAVGATPAAGARFVLVTVTITNTSEVPVELDPATLILRDREGFLYGPDTALQAELAGAGTPAAGVATTPLGGGELAPDEERSGSLGYAVPEDADLGEVLWVPVAGRLIFLHRFTAPVAADTPADAPALRTITRRDEAPEATATPEPTDEDEDQAETDTLPECQDLPTYEVGTAVLTTDDANLRTEPTVESESLGIVPVGTQLQITDPFVDQPECDWWPVTNPATGESGYIREDLLEAAGE